MAGMRRMVGNGDLVWVGLVTSACALVAHLLVGHLQARFETVRVGNQLHEAAAERRDLEERIEAARVDAERVVNPTTLREEAARLGLETPAEDAWIVVEER